MWLWYNHGWIANWQRQSTRMDDHHHCLMLLGVGYQQKDILLEDKKMELEPMHFVLTLCVSRFKASATIPTTDAAFYWRSTWQCDATSQHGCPARQSHYSRPVATCRTGQMGFAWPWKRNGTWSGHKWPNSTQSIAIEPSWSYGLRLTGLQHRRNRRKSGGIGHVHTKPSRAGSLKQTTVQGL